MKIRNVEYGDASAVQSVFYLTWLATYPNIDYGITKEDIHEKFKSAFDLVTLEKLAVQFENLSKQIIYLVAEEDSKIIGLCRVYVKSEKNELNAIYVLPEHQNKGVGKALWFAAFDLLDPSKETSVNLVVYNKNARLFYEKLGFIDTGRRFSDPAFIMPISKNPLPEMEMKKPRTN